MDSAELQEAYGKPLNWFARARLHNSFERVAEFHRVFGHPINTEPTEANDERSALRLSLILEEACELAEALGFDPRYVEKEVALMLEEGPGEPDIVAVADALGDLEYVTNGAALEMGIDLPAVVKEIHRSNMTKLGPDGKPIYREDGKILKGEGYEPPNLEKVLWSE